MRKSSSLRISLLYGWAVLLTLITSMLGAAPLKVLHVRLGSAAYWLIGTGVTLLLYSAGLPVAAGAFIISAALIGVYSEFEQRGFSVNQSGAFAVTSVTLGLAGAFYFWALSLGKAWRTTVLGKIESLLGEAHLMGLPASEALKPETIALQGPSLVIVVLGLALLLALILERTFSNWARVPFRRREKLNNFKVPDAVIWPTIAALLAAFGQFDSRWVGVVGLNVLNVCGLLYFFQGLAILAKYFEVFRIGAIWRVLWVILLAVNLPIVLGIVGLTDYWLDFRKVFNKKAAELQKKRVEE